jgi:hypothetical protein
MSSAVQVPLKSTHSTMRYICDVVALGDRAFEAEFAACDLQTLDDFAGAHEQHAPSVLDERKSDGCREMARSCA